jgi:AcrR family transcriptional regulator
MGVAAADRGRGGTRERLIEAAVQVVARAGLEKASVKAIAAEAGIGPGLMHYHFANKEAVLEEALSQASQAYAKRLRQLRLHHRPGEMMRAYLDLAAAAVGDDMALFRVRLAFAARAMADPELAARFRRTNASSLEETACLFAADRGETKPSADDWAQAKVVKACYDGIMLSLQTDPEFPVGASVQLFRRALGVEA